MTLTHFKNMMLVISTSGKQPKGRIYILNVFWNRIFGPECYWEGDQFRV